MGVQFTFNDYLNKWELRGWGFRWQFNTREEAEAKRKDAWEEHKANLKGFQITHNMLVAYR